MNVVGGVYNKRSGGYHFCIVNNFRLNGLFCIVQKAYFCDTKGRVMICVYNTIEGTFTGYNDISTVSSLSGVRADVLKVLGDDVISIGIFLIGSLTLIKSNRGGDRGTNNFKNVINKTQI